MIKILSKDGRISVHLASDGKPTGPTLESLSLICTLSDDSFTRSVHARFLRNKLEEFALSLEEMYVSFKLHSQATLWSNDGRVVISLTSMPLGQIDGNCLLSRGKSDDEFHPEEFPIYKEHGLSDEECFRTPVHLYRPFQLDQSYLPILVDEVRRASRYHTPWD